MAFKKLFNYKLFEKKFCNELTYNSLVEYYEIKYSNLKSEYIWAFIKYISTVLITEFRGPTLNHRLNAYSLIHKVLFEELGEEELEKISWRRGINLLQECKLLTEDYIKIILNENVTSNLEFSVETENLSDYISLIEEIVEDRLFIILSYINNYLREAFKKEIDSQQLSLPPTLQLLALYDDPDKIFSVEKSKENKRVNFVANVSEESFFKKKEGGKCQKHKRKYDETFPYPANNPCKQALYGLDESEPDPPNMFPPSVI